MKHTNMTQQSFFEDTEQFKLYRENDPETSKAAANSAPTGKMRQFVFDLITKAGENGTTIKEMTASHIHMSTSSISSRPNELEKVGLVFYKGDKRDNSRVIRHIKYKEDDQT